MEAAENFPGIFVQRLCFFADEDGNSLVDAVQGSKGGIETQIADIVFEFGEFFAGDRATQYGFKRHLRDQRRGDTPGFSANTTRLPKTDGNAREAKKYICLSER